MNKEYGTCPVCNGTGGMPCPDYVNAYAKERGWYGYKADTDTVDCTNCGGQYQFQKPTGLVGLRSDGTPCRHGYKGSAGPWRCTTDYTCVHCGDKYMIDSGD